MMMIMLVSSHRREVEEGEEEEDSKYEIWLAIILLLKIISCKQIPPTHYYLPTYLPISWKNVSTNYLLHTTTYSPTSFMYPGRMFL